MPPKRTNPIDGSIVKSFISAEDARALTEIAAADERSVASVLRRLIHAYVEDPDLRRLVRERIAAEHEDTER
ncbi:MAG: hypothetical protein DLM64_06090 [Solirubrobacterales bacterium]|nr:MAG: hypothetical protein DLM64_06090 [Solirubrobacterales bacterium]